jgi:sarcosine oxidase subunit gamma
MAKAARIETAARQTMLGALRHAKGRSAMEAAPPALRISLRAPEASVAAISKAIGFALPHQPKTSASTGDTHALWLGPDEWLVTVFHSAVDVSHRNAALIVSGAGAADVLNAGCPQDLSLAAFAVGACSRTILGKAEVVLYRTAENQFRVEMWRSFAPYVADFIEDAIRRDC